MNTLNDAQGVDGVGEESKSSMAIDVDVVLYFAVLYGIYVVLGKIIYCVIEPVDGFISYN